MSGRSNISSSTSSRHGLNYDPSLPSTSRATLGHLGAVPKSKKHIRDVKEARSESARKKRKVNHGLFSPNLVLKSAVRSQRKSKKAARELQTESEMESEGNDRGDLQMKIREMEENRRILEEKAESKKAKIVTLNRKLRSIKKERTKAQKYLDSIQDNLEKYKKDIKDKNSELSNLRSRLSEAEKNLQKAEVERTKAESRKSHKTSCQDDFFRDVMSNFKEMVESNLQCSICNELFVTPATVTCGHTFCEQCIDQWKLKNQEQRPNCPICRAEIKSQVQSLVMADYISKAVDNFFPDEVKKQRAELVEERQALKVAQEADIRSQRVNRRSVYFRGFPSLVTFEDDTSDSETDSNWIPDIDAQQPRFFPSPHYSTASSNSSSHSESTNSSNEFSEIGNSPSNVVIGGVWSQSLGNSEAGWESSESDDNLSFEDVLSCSEDENDEANLSSNHHSSNHSDSSEYYF